MRRSPPDGAYVDYPRKAGMMEAMLGELLAIDGMASATNALADSYQIPVEERFKV